MRFRTQIKLRCILGAVCIAFGIVMLCVGQLNNNGQAGIELFFVSGVVLIAIGLLWFVRYSIALRDKNKLEELKIHRKDERVLHLNYKSGYAAFFVSIAGLYLYTMYLLITASPLFDTFSYLCSIPVCIYLVCYIVIKKFN